MNLMNWPTIQKDKKKLRFAERRALSKIRPRKQSRSSGQTRKFQQDCDGSRGTRVLLIAPLLSLFATSHLLNSTFGCIRVLEHHSLQTNALPAGSLGTGQTPLSILATATPTATGPCQLPQPLPLPNEGTLERPGTDEYCNAVDPISNFVGIEETDLLEHSYVDYFECSESVIVKGRLRANVQFWESIGASHFVLSVITEGYKIPFYYTPTSVFLTNNKSALLHANFD